MPVTMISKPISFLLLIWLFVSGLAQSESSVIAVDRIVAVVNNGVITRHELDQRVERAIAQLSRQNTPAPPRKVLERQVLERSIVEMAIIQHADETGIRVESTQLDRAVARIAASNGIDVERFREELEKDGIPFDEFREDIRREMIIGRVRERDVDNRVSVSETEIDHFLANQAQLGGRESEFRIAHILVQVPEQASPEEIAKQRAKAETALTRLKAGDDFAQISAAYSDAPNALQGGDLGWRSAGQVPTLFAEAASSLQPGEISALLKSANGFHILKLLDKRGKDVTLVVQQTHAQHILIKPNEVVSDDDARRRLLQLKERVENGAVFDELAKLHSDDPSAAKGGDLGWISPGDTVPEFEKAMNALQPGGLSEPVRSPFGWHLIQVLEHRQQDVTAERQRVEARQALRSRKIEEAYQDWVRQLRDSAYVEYRLDD
jgi:peptidyl-prolyl cis-trans isomerase SurA